LRAQPELWLFDDAPILGGAEVFALRLVSFLATSGTGRIRVVCPPESELARRCKEAGVEHVPAAFPSLGPRRAPRWPAAVRSVRALLRTAGSEAIAIGNTARAQAYLTAAALASRSRPRIVQLIHEQETLARISGRFAFRRVGSLVAVGGNVAEACRRALPGVEFERANLFVNPEEVPTPPPLPTGRGEPVIGALTRLIPEKGILELLEELASAGSWSEARIDGPAQDPAYAGRVRERIEQLGLGERVSLLGVVDDLHGFLAGIDVLVAPSTGTEGQGFGVVEALWHGRPSLVRQSAFSAADFKGLPVRSFSGADELERGLRELPGAGVPADEVRRRFGPEQALDAILRAAQRS
jgi:glycosyltransferase involved in cell wall biosynthesis